MNTLTINSKRHNYNIIVYENLVTLLKKYLSPEQKYFVLIDSVLYKKYKNILLECAPNCLIMSIKGGESAKTIKTYEKVSSKLLKAKISKNDVLVAFGGGTITDLTGYIASTYKRGIKYINIPTTTLSMIDASIGGKNALNIGGIKNAIGTIYPPEQVLIGLDVLETLPEEHFLNGLFEALKMGLILDKNLFNIFKEDYKNKLKEIVIRSLELKKQIVELDEDEKGIRKILNFGHTYGHALELNPSYSLLHGQAVANGMLMLSKDKPYRNELISILEQMKCPIISDIDSDELIEVIKNDKKSNSKTIDLIEVPEVGKAIIEKIEINELKGRL